MLARWSTFAVWALAAGSALFWGLKLFVSPPAAPAHAQVAGAGNAARGDLTRLLGAEAPPPAAEPAAPADSRFQLIGVVTPRAAASAREGLALIAVDGKPPKAFRVGAVVEGQTVLKAVAARGATLGPREGAGALTLALAPPAAAATGVLPPPGGARATPTVAPPLVPLQGPALASPNAPPVTPTMARRGAQSIGQGESVQPGQPHDRMQTQ
ncbi:MAG: hypothetical protein Q8K96_01765 [Rubrivivax sp.]|nr:hypothetical protein [Rubrivivax sp.]